MAYYSSIASDINCNKIEMIFDALQKILFIEYPYDNAQIMNFIYH